MNFNSMSLMATTSITVYETKQLGETGSCVRHIEITDKDGSVFDIAIHADSRDALEIKDKQ